jgi:4-hydroxybenzoate polyprenyltransferase
VPPASRWLPAGLIRLVHPFPILLDGVATAAIALVAGGDWGVAIKLGVAMFALQASIGALNDLVDAAIDAGRKPGKPIPTGTVGADLARVVVVGSAGLGLVLSATFSAGLLLVAGLGLAVGYAYDLVAKGGAWSWLPFALGLPLLPVFAWFGATGSLPAPFVVLVPTAVLAGAALAIANALADVGRDEDAAVRSIAISLGTRRAWIAGAALQLTVSLIAVGSLAAADGGALPTIAAALSAALVLAGVALGRTSSPSILERAWEVQAVGVALLGVSWLWGMVGSG